MSAHLDRALVLLQQSRYDLAQNEIRQALAEDPDLATAHAILGLCLSGTKQYREATAEAQQAVHLAPDTPYCHYALASIYYDRDCFEEALEAIQEAVRLDPFDADYHGAMSEIYFHLRRWDRALETAEEGLAVDPEHVSCTNGRARALLQLGRRMEADAAVEAALAKDPEDAVSHATRGWSLLEQGNHQKALEHFREALRLEPQFEWAREGIVEALKSRQLLYKPILWFLLWMSKLSRKAQWAVIIGGFLGYRLVLSQVSDEWRWPVIGLFTSIVWLTWIGDPLFNLLLRLDRFGRMALSREQIVASNWIGLCLLAGLTCLAIGLITWNRLFLGTAAGLGYLILPLAAIFNCSPGTPRILMTIYTGLMAACGSVCLGCFILAQHAAKNIGVKIQLVALLLLVGFAIMALLSTWIASALMMIRVRR